MNLKSKLFGFGATTLLALSIATGAMAAEPGGSTDAQVELKVRGNGVCTMTVDLATQKIEFGDRTWGNAAWSTHSDPQDISGSVTTGKNKQLCDVQAQSAGVFNTSSNGTGGTLAGQIDLLVGPNALTGTSWLSVDSDLPTGSWGTSVSLDAADVNDEPGVYEGTIDFQVVSSGA